MPGMGSDWFFGGRKDSYARARKNTAAMAAEMRGSSAEDERTALAALDGDESFVLGTISSGEEVRLAPREVGRHGMVWGSSGAGKSYGLVIITNGWSAGGTRRLQLIDPKGETYLLKSLDVAADYLDLPNTERDAFAARFRVFDVTADVLTPFNLFAVPKGMSPSLLASLRATATRHMSGHDYSDLMEYGVFLLYSAAINIQCGITVKFVRAFFLDAEFRARVILPKIADARLRDSIEHIETTLPAQTCKAIVRQFDILLSSAPARISFGLSPSMVQSLAPADPRATDFLGNFGPTPQRSPALAKAMAINRLIDVLNDANVREEIVPEMVLVEEVGVIVRQPAVADFLLEASRTLRWKGLSIVTVAQDPANAIPRETCEALKLNSKWFLAFECGKDEALWLFPHVIRAPGKSESEQRQSFVREMAKLPTQQAVLVKKGLPAIRFRTRDLDDPTTRYPREVLAETFEQHIAHRSMVRVKDAEKLIATWEADLFASYSGSSPSTVPGTVKGPQSGATATRGISDLFALLDRARGKSEGEEGKRG
jgi:hypothetical protein